MRRPRRSGFTIVEMVVVFFVVVIVLLLLNQMLLGTSRDVAYLTQDLDINLRVMRVLDRIARDVRSASKIDVPAAVGGEEDILYRADPAFRLAFNFGANTELVLARHTRDFNDPALRPRLQTIEWRLADRRQRGRLAGPTPAPVFVYTLRRTVTEEGRTEPLEDGPVAKDVLELVFFKWPGTQSKLHVRLKIQDFHKRRDGLLVSGYAANMETAIHLRGASGE